MTRYTSLLITIFFIQFLQAQIVQVRDKNTHQPLELVTIFSANGHTITNMKGQSDISRFEGVDDITFRLIGYETRILSFEELKQLGFKVWMEQSELSLDEVVVSATKWKQGRRETPSKISILKPKEVNFFNPQTAADLIEMSGDVFVQKSQMGGGSPMIRGFATNRVLITVDGVRMNNAIFRSGNIQNIISLDPFATNRAEVIFGPGSVIYGSDAIGGVMGFYTFDPILSHDNNTLIKATGITRYASANNEKTGHASINFGFDKLASFTSITFSDFGNLTMGSDGPDDYLRHEYIVREAGEDISVKNGTPEKQVPTAYSQLNLMQKFKFMPNERWQFNYGLHYSESSNVPRYDRLIMYTDNNELKYGDWYYGPQKWLMNNLNIQHTANNAYFNHLNITASYQFFEESRHNRKLDKEDITRRTEQVDAYSLNLDFEKLLGNGDRVFYGFEFIGNQVGSSAYTESLISGDKGLASTRYPDNSIWISAAVYGNYLKKLSAKTNLQTGLRYNYIYLNADFDNVFFDFPFEDTQLNNGALTGSFGVIHNPTDNWQLSAALSTGFRAPNIDDVGKIFDSEPGAVVVPNPDLKPEYAINGEIGAAVVVVKKWKVDVAAYYTLLTNAMVRRDYQLNAEDSIIYDHELSKVQAIQNAAHAKVYGIQAGIEYKWKSGISASSRFNYQKGKEELEDGSYSPLRHAAPWFGTTHLSYEKSKLKMDVYLRYNGEVSFNEMPKSEIDKAYLYASDANGNPYSPGWTTLNLKAQYAFNSHALITAGIDNITNERYKSYSSGIAAPGRNYIVSLKVSL